MKFDLIIFDCDGVLVNSERIANAVESECLSRLGVLSSPEETRGMFKGKTVAEVAAIVQQKCGKELPSDWLYEWAMATALGFFRSLRAVDGVTELLENLHQSHIKTCVASQSPLPRVELSLSITGLSKFFGNRVFTSSMVGRPKPAPDLFLFAAEHMGVSTHQTAVIEDSESGVIAARAAGMAVFGFAEDEDATVLARSGAHIFRTMRMLPAILDIDPNQAGRDK